ncbi:MAG: hypothetical protein KatS3mg012_1778 [Gaiellaceae bacterium]|jgi:hypothetical protein|nr:MAG: hypothetical protein KatS3mg012_1778 [Gaiellaceae bacterium]
MKKLVVIAVLVAFSSPAAYAAPPEGKGAPNTTGAGQTAQSQQQGTGVSPDIACRAERQSMGVEAFRNKYGTNPNKANAFGKCVSAKSKEQRKAREAKENAAKKCKAELASMGVEAFRNKYGTNPNKANAFGKCVSAMAKALRSSDD